MNAHPSTSSGLRIIGLLLAIGSALACTAILKPDDAVTRCGNADDCEPTGDNRYVPECRFDEAHKDTDITKVDKICVAIFKPISCDPVDLMSQPMHPVTIAAGNSSCANVSCDAANNGRLGCPTDSGMCSEGSPMETAEGVRYCGEDGVVAGFALPDELDLRHISDMYCKSFFCDEDFVCGPNGKCQPCEGDDFADGGCGIVYVDGAPAPVYVLGDALTEGCAGPDAEFDEALFGGGCGA